MNILRLLKHKDKEKSMNDKKWSMNDNESCNYSLMCSRPVIARNENIEPHIIDK